jgi:methionine biosynthesis protein MetW
MKTREFYNSQAFEEGAIITGRIRKAAKMFATRGGPYERLLDIGCGVGNIALYLKEATGAEEVYGVEIAENQVRAAWQRGVQAVALDMNVGNVPFEDGFFDAIFCGEVIEHLVDTDHLLEEIYRTLSPQGLCVLTTPNLAAWYNRLALLLGFQPFYTQVSFHHPVGRLPLVGGFGAGGHLRVFTLRALKGLVQVHRLRVVAVAGASIFDMDVPSRMPLLQRAAGPIDRLFSLKPSLSCDIIIALAKE